MHICMYLYISVMCFENGYNLIIFYLIYSGGMAVFPSYCDIFLSLYAVKPFVLYVYIIFVAGLEESF